MLVQATAGLPGTGVATVAGLGDGTGDALGVEAADGTVDGGVVADADAMAVGLGDGVGEEPHPVTTSTRRPQDRAMGREHGASPMA